MCEIGSKLTIKIAERCRWRRYGIFIVNFGQISYYVLVFLLLTLNKLAGLSFVKYLRENNDDSNL